MARKEEMNWDTNKKRWHKMYRGVMYRVVPSELHGAHGHTRELSRAAANEWWQRKRAALDGPPPDRALIIEELEQESDLRRIMSQGDAARRIVSALDGLGKQASAEEIEAAVIRVLGDTAGTVAEERAGQLREVLTEATGSNGVTPDRTFKACCEGWLAVIRGEVEPASYRELYEFTQWLTAHELTPASADVGIIDGPKVKALYLAVKGEDWSDGRRNKRWGFFKRFVRHLWGEGLIALPNNIDQYSFKVKTKAIRRYPVETVRACLGKLPARLQCYALLAVNCGMTNIDVGKLRHDMVNLEAGTLTRRRSKLEDAQNAPIVTYKLWPETLARLKEFKSDHPVFFLTSKAGTPLVESRHLGGDDVRHKDLVSKQWRGKDGQAKRGVPFKAFRSVGATELEGSKDYGRFSNLYLANSPKSIKDKHYAAPPEELFAEALGWLRTKILGGAVS